MSDDQTTIGADEGPPAHEPGEGASLLPDLPAPAADEWLIDGYNLLHAVLLKPEERASRWWSRAMRTRVLEMAHRLATGAAVGAPVSVVFDGKDEKLLSAPLAGPTVIYAKSADRWIAKYVRASSLPERIAVVTADRPLASRVSHAGAAVVHPRTLVAACSDDDSRSQPELPTPRHI